jgi:hypothetical protein
MALMKDNMLPVIQLSHPKCDPHAACSYMLGCRYGAVHGKLGMAWLWLEAKNLHEGRPDAACAGASALNLIPMLLV